MPTSAFWVAAGGIAVVGTLAAPGALLVLHFPAVGVCGGAAALLAYSAVRRRSRDRGRTRFARHRTVRNAMLAMFAAGAAAGAVAALVGPAPWTSGAGLLGRALVGAGTGVASALVGSFLIMVGLLVKAEREVTRSPGADGQGPGASAG